MSVYTTVNQSELEEFLSGFNAGSLVKFEGISAGIENTNYFVDTTDGRFVLTIFESLGFNELPFFLDLMAHLAESHVPSAHPIANSNGDYLSTLKQKPAALVQRLNGKHNLTPGVEHCASVGRALAEMHLAVSDFKKDSPNPRDFDWKKSAAAQVKDKLTPQDKELLEDEIKFQALYSRDNLPSGIIHADLFRDNVLFVDHEVSGIIDFYYACKDALLYDIAVAVNDWCFMKGNVNREKLEALLSAYNTSRKLNALEKGAWPVVLRAAALRFWLSRLLDLHFPRDGEITHTKDPDEFKAILLFHRKNENLIRSCWQS
jgi:homoserine kinase type II